MSLLARLEKKFGRFAVPNLTAVLIVGQVLVYVPWRFAGREDILERIVFIPQKVLEGEVWRLVTFAFQPPGGAVLWAVIFWMVFYLMGNYLEHFWGTFRYNVYLLLGTVASLAVAFLVPAQAATNLFLYNSVFLAFAFLFPDFVFRLFFILPIKVKWLALINWLVMGFWFLVGASRGDWIQCVLILASIANFLIFFGRELIHRVKDRRRRAAFQARVRGAKQAAKYRHRCTLCGVTNVEDPKRQFRYCSKCEGNLCYCMEHIASHAHVAGEAE